MTTKQKYILLAAGIGILTVLSIPFNRLLYSSLKSNESAKQKEAKPIESEEIKSEGRNVPTPENPAKFAILAQKKSDRPVNQSQSDAEMKKSLAQGKVLDLMEAESAFESIQMTPAEYKRRLEEINGRIKYFEGLKRDSVHHDEAIQKLETLYRLKSTLTVLKSKIISKKASP